MPLANRNRRRSVTSTVRRRGPSAILRLEPEPGPLRRIVRSVAAQQGFLLGRCPSASARIEEDAPHERVEEHHVLVGRRIHVEAGVGGAPPGAETVDDRRLAAILVRGDPLVQAVDPMECAPTRPGGP